LILEKVFTEMFQMFLDDREKDYIYRLAFRGRVYLVLVCKLLFDIVDMNWKGCVDGGLLFYGNELASFMYLIRNKLHKT
jgi:hypothetical protein